ncbi:arylsulfatase [Pseudomaricurvus alkylphenolicus]|nr:arylsulfatase [Pseudomaricurvus alkylphenolicus]
MADTGRPNILVILADDLGFSDIGSFGGEIDTPNLDALANRGTKFSNFYAAPTCSPTRSMLLTGTDNHQAGLGNMAEVMKATQDSRRGKPGYEGYLNQQVVTVATLLRNAGYHTYMAGKWHLGLDPMQSPAERGFDRSFALLHGAASHFDVRGHSVYQPIASYREGNHTVELPGNFYSSEFYTDKMIEFISSDDRDQQPFFAYLAYTAPHWPLQAPDDLIEKYKDRYITGYLPIATRRLKKLKRLELIPNDVKIHEADLMEQRWNALDSRQQQIEAKRMAVYAAMVDSMDHHIGRLVRQLKLSGQYENTLIIFLSDNGPEGVNASVRPGVGEWMKQFDNRLENMGRPTSFIDQGSDWAQAVATPFRLYKGYPTEGGTRVPAFISFPGALKAPGVSHEFASVLDITPTLLDLAQVSHPGSRYRGRMIHEPMGTSMLPYLMGRTTDIHSPGYAMGWELFGHRAIRRGDWKLLSIGTAGNRQSWSLYDLSKDISERRDLSQKYPKITSELISLWNRYEKKAGLLPPSNPKTQENL